MTSPRILVTGATGFIGAHVLAPLGTRGFEVHSLGRRPPHDPAVRHHPADLLDPAATAAAVEQAQASHLLHLAWSVPPGQFWTAPQNLDWVAASLHLVRAFAQAGGRRVIGAGTCAEYDWTGAGGGTPATLYGTAKDALRRVLAAYGGIELAWGRIFHLYGPGEPPGRLVSGAIATLRAGERFATSHGRQRRDMLHVADVAGAFAALADSPALGTFDIGTGQARPVRTVIETIGRQLGALDRIDWGARPLPASEPELLQADAARLRDEVGFTPRFDLERGVAHTIEALAP